MVLTEGIFKGQKAILLLPEVKPENRPSLLSLPPEVRNLIYEELFRGTNDKITIARQKRNGKVRAYMTVLVKGRNGYIHEQDIAPLSRIAIFRCNRQVYEETTTLFYGTKTFSAPTTKKMVALLKEMGPATAHIRKLEVLAPRYESLRQFYRLLEEIVNLETLRLDSRWWVETPHSAHRVYGYARWRTLNLKYCHRNFMPFLQAMQKHQQDIQAVSQIIQFDNRDCNCKGYDSVKQEYRCQAVTQEIEQYAEDFRQLVIDSLQASENASKEEAMRKREEEQSVVEELDDYSYLDPAPAPERRETGRPKRRTVTEKSVSSAE